ncbi:hypothetical protein K492DRAFT_178094 [Lichtheimia hyalospora FSU 10163]|nr:hypothetical protein K492DRAFT_178094 [Lichtheimia hyalospora FSU 10163]
MQQMNSAGLLQMSSKQLKNYIRAYNLSAKAAIEKGDLVRIILNTRPISNESEVYYRSHRHEHLPISPQQASDGSSSNAASSTISQIFNDIFNGGGSSSNNNSNSSGSDNRQREQERLRQRAQEQQRQRQEQELRRQQRTQEQRRQRQEQELRRQQQAQEQRRQRQEQELRRQQRAQEQQRQQQSRPSDASANTSTRKEDTISVDDMILSKIDPKSLSVKTLKAILRANFVEQAHALEKSDLVSRVQWLIDERRKELSANDQTPVNEDSLCRICCDAQQNCVFLDCGHMVTCMDCGKQLVSSKNECPICREPILKLVHVFRS